MDTWRAPSDTNHTPFSSRVQRRNLPLRNSHTIYTIFDLSKANFDASTNGNKAPSFFFSTLSLKCNLPVIMLLWNLHFKDLSISPSHRSPMYGCRRKRTTETIRIFFACLRLAPGTAPTDHNADPHSALWPEIMVHSRSLRTCKSSVGFIGSFNVRLPPLCILICDGTIL